MDEILIKMLLASLIQSVKNPEKKVKLKKISAKLVQTLILAYQDDPEFMSFLNEEEIKK